MPCVAAPEPFSITFDGTAPTASLYSPLWDPTSADFIPITVTFSECVTDFTLDDVNLSSGTTCGLRALTPCRRLEPYVLDFEVWGMVSGNFTANISAWAVMDLAGNGNVVVPEYGITVDKTQPQVELSSDTPSPTNQNITVTGGLPFTLSMHTSATAVLTCAPHGCCAPATWHRASDVRRARGWL